MERMRVGGRAAIERLGLPTHEHLNTHKFQVSLCEGMRGEELTDAPHIRVHLLPLVEDLEPPGCGPCVLVAAAAVARFPGAVELSARARGGAAGAAGRPTNIARRFVGDTSSRTMGDPERLPGVEGRA